MADSKPASGVKTRRPFIIAVDGPSASGKTSVSRGLAARLGCEWVSTGAFYRGLALLALKRQVEEKDEVGLSRLCHDPAWQVQATAETTRVLIDGEDLTERIGSDEAGQMASRISQLKKVREALLAPQQRFGLGKKGLIAEGRDIGSVIFPDADVKIYLTATSQDRAHRRAQELGDDLAQTKISQKLRDTQDQTRKVAPLLIPENALVMDTSGLDLEEVVNQLEKHVRYRLAL